MQTEWLFFVVVIVVVVVDDNQNSQGKFLNILICEWMTKNERFDMVGLIFLRALSSWQMLKTRVIFPGAVSIKI